MDFSRMNQRITFLENRTVIDEIGNHTSKMGRGLFLLGKRHREKLCRNHEYRSHKRNSVLVIRGSAVYFSAVCEPHYT